MLKHFILLLVFCFGFQLNAQDIGFTTPDYKAIEKEINDKNSKFFYPKLMERLVKNDTLLTHDEYSHLYLGYFFQPKYNAFWTPSEDEKLRSYYDKENLETSDYDEIIKLANITLTEFPFDLRQLNYLAYVYHLKGDETAAKKIAFKFHSILNVILSSGDGKKCETGFHVLMVDHEYILLNLFEIESKEQSLVGNCDYLSFEKGVYNVDGLYFNVEKMLENERKILK